MSIQERVNSLKELMEKKSIDAYVIPSSDSHQSEYVADYFKSRKYISGFTGSAGSAIITKDFNNGVWTDGRYFIQAEKELKGSPLDLYRMREKGVPTINEYLRDTLPEGSTIGLDGRLFNEESIRGMKEELKEKNFKFVLEDLMDEVWPNRPSMPKEKIIRHDVKYAGKSTREKVEEVRSRMKAEKATAYMISSLDDIAWLFNIRGNDMPFSPVAYAHACLDMDNVVLYIDAVKVSEEIMNELTAEGVTVKDYDAIWSDIKELNSDLVVAIDPKRNSHALYEAVSAVAKVKDIKEITTLLKAMKNEVEVENLRKASIRDNVAMVRFLHWIDSSVGKETITELDIEEKLLQLRGEMENNRGASFATIAAYGGNAALAHYKATEESHATLEPRGLLLVDSGGQYLDGTTDITRTMALGEITEDERNNYTRVLKGHMAMSSVKFPQGTKGYHIDALARMALWQEGLDYRHGTGHGFGFFLNVHEGPQSLSQHPIDVAFEPGMVITNEPGYYVADEYGIRLENDLIVVVDQVTEYGTFLKFENLTYCPFDLKALNANLLTAEEKQWLNSYHKKVFEKLSPFVEGEVLEWLKENTREV